MLRSRLRIWPLLLLVAPSTANAQTSQATREPPDTARLEQVVTTQMYEVRLPRAWRQLTPDEYLALRSGLPQDMIEAAPRPGLFEHWGDIDRWLRDGFDGVAMTIQINLRGEPVIDETAINATRQSIAELAAQTPFGLEIVDCALTAIGESKHPGVATTLRIRSGPGPLHTLASNLVLPSGGSGLSFQFRAFESDFAQTTPLFQAIRDSMRFAKPPAGKSATSDKIFNAIWIGAIVGLGLIVLRWLAKGPPVADRY